MSTTTMTRTASPATKTATDARARGGETVWMLYCAAAFGAFCLGLGDLLNNSNASTVIKLGQILREHVWQGLSSSGGVALLMLVLLGGAVCWLQQPTTRLDAFARGFSVFAILAVTAPYQAPTAGLGDPAANRNAPNPVTAPGLTGLVPGGPAPHGAMAFAAAVRPAADVRLAGDDSGRAVVHLLEPDGRTPVTHALLTVRERASARVVGSDTVKSSPVEIRKPSGKYWVEVEKAGYQRVRFQLDLTDGRSQVLQVKIPPSKVPLNLQRLGAAEEVRPTAVRGGTGATA